MHMAKQKLSLLEACDLENMKSSALTEQQLTEVNGEFKEHLVLMSETVGIEDETSLKSKKRSSKLECSDN
jgi:hypothetical protein